MLNKLSLKFLGGAGTVTGSKTLLEFNRQKCLSTVAFRGPGKTKTTYNAEARSPSFP